MGEESFYPGYECPGCGLGTLSPFGSCKMWCVVCHSISVISSPRKCSYCEHRLECLEIPDAKEVGY